jgi:CheY-like chemotaxis protein
MRARVQIEGSPAPTAGIMRSYLLLSNRTYALWALVVLLGCIGGGRAADPYVDALDKRFSTGTGEVPITSVDALEDRIKEQARKLSQAPARIAPAPPSRLQQTLVGTLLAAAAFGVAFLVPVARRRWNDWLEAPAKQLERTASIMAEDPALEVFFRALREGPDVALTATLSGEPGSQKEIPGRTIEAQTPPALDPTQEDFALAGKHLAILRTSFSELIAAPNDAERLNIGQKLLEQVGLVKESSLLPRLRPVWLMAFALDGLLKQLLSKTASITPSALRTTAAALDLMEALCVPSLRPDLATNPPVRLLAVDDDLISRRAVSLALKKAFDEPDLATDGHGALGLASQHPYDVIFLDVEMPGMDGFELCSKIHETVPNRTTPVVFVTMHSDFDSRIKSTVLGAYDLIAKPFLTFEITVKTLTLVLRSRLEGGDFKQASSESEKSGLTAGAQACNALPKGSEVAPLLHASCQPASPPSEPGMSPNRTNAVPESRLDTKECPPVAGAVIGATDATTRELSHGEPTGPLRPSRREFARAFFMRAPEHLQVLHQRLASARHVSHPPDRDEFLRELCLGVHAMCCEASHAQLGTVSRLGSALEAMLKKLLKRPQLCTPSTFSAAATALDTLDALCEAGADLDLLQPPVHLLVVDDDPVARRAIGGALQLAFGRPDSADGGEAALALAGEKPYDLIFLDVIMPGIDGFTTCDRLRQTALNSHTPVVFVTSLDDTNSRNQAAASGGCSFIPKPVLSSEIALVALSFIVRARLAKQAPALDTLDVPAQTDQAVVEAVPCLVGSRPTDC